MTPHPKSAILCNRNTSLRASTNKLAEIQLGSSVETIESHAFRFCEGLTAIRFPESLTRICSEAFFQCTGLTALIFPDILDVIESRAFGCCNGITEIDLGSGVREIGACAFRESQITDITIPQSTEIIAKYAFAGCEQLAGATLLNPSCEISEIGISDAVLLARFISEDIWLTDAQIKWMLRAGPDFNEDGQVTILDLEALLKSLGAE